MSDKLSSEAITRIEILKPLLFAYPKSGMTSENIKTYAIALTILSEAELQAAVLRCMRVHKFFPSIAEIIEAAESVAGTANKSTTPTAGEAWNMAMNEARSKAHFLAPEIKDEYVAEAVKLFGWTELHSIEEKQVGTARAQFMKIYDGVVNRRKEQRINENVIQIMPSKGREQLKERVQVLVGGKQ